MKSGLSMIVLSLFVGLLLSGCGGGGAGDDSYVPVLKTFSGGYVQSGTWEGYAYTNSEGSSIAPANYFGLSAGERLSAIGTVDKADDYSNYALIAFNINQNQSGDTAVYQASLTGDGVRVIVENPAGSPLRVVLYQAGGSTWYGYDLTGTDTSILYPAFNTQPWDLLGTPFNKGSMQIEAIGIFVPSNDSSNVDFNVTIVDIYEY